MEKEFNREEALQWAEKIYKIAIEKAESKEQARENLRRAVYGFEYTEDVINALVDTLADYLVAIIVTGGDKVATLDEAVHAIQVMIAERAHSHDLDTAKQIADIMKMMKDNEQEEDV